MREDERDEGDTGVPVDGMVMGLRVAECGVVMVVGEEDGEPWRKDHGFAGRESSVLDFKRTRELDAGLEFQMSNRPTAIQAEASSFVQVGIDSRSLSRRCLISFPI